MEISVRGTASTKLAPERATLTVTASAEGPNKAKVLADTTALVQRLSAEIERLRSAPDEPVTWSAVLPIGTRSWRPWSDKGKVLPLQYAANATIRLRFRDFRALAAFADAWGGVEGVTLGRVEWTLTDEVRKDTERAVLAEAVGEARDRAQVLATAAGAGEVTCVQLADPGLLVSVVNEAAMSGQPMYALRGRAGAAGDMGGDEGIEIAPQEIEVEAVIEARFAADIG